MLTLHFGDSNIGVDSTLMVGIDLISYSRRAFHIEVGVGNYETELNNLRPSRNREDWENKEEKNINISSQKIAKVCIIEGPGWHFKDTWSSMI